MVYVNAMVLVRDDHEGIQGLKQYLFRHFQTKELGRLWYFLRIDVVQSKTGIAISQKDVEETRMLDCKQFILPFQGRYTQT